MEVHQNYLRGEQQDIPNLTLSAVLEKALRKRTTDAQRSTVEDNERHVTYAQLNNLANRLARVLASFVRVEINIVDDDEEDDDASGSCFSCCRKSRRRLRSAHVVPIVIGQPLIALDVAPSIELIALQLAAWKLGAAELTLDGDLPKDRVQAMFGAVRPAVVITDETSGCLFLKRYIPESAKLLRLNDLLELEGSTSNLSTSEMLLVNDVTATAAVMFTSGSTGEPKGIRISHENLLNRLLWQWNELPYNIEDYCIAKTSITFVDSLTETFGPLLKLVPLVIAPKGLSRNLTEFHDVLDSKVISRLVVVPTLLSGLLQVWKRDAAPSNLRYIICSGETLPLSLVEEFQQFMPKNVRLFNFYGSTEVTGDATWQLVAGKGAARLSDVTWQGNIAIGGPVSNTNVYLLGTDQRPLRQGRVGEIAIAGRNVATLVKDSSQLVNITDPIMFERVIPCYRTGDKGTIVKNRLYFLGRGNSEIKRRGVRINLLEIEKTLSTASSVDKAVVLYHMELLEIFAFVKMRASVKKRDLSDAVQQLGKKLPPYMIPFIIDLDTFPVLEATGKLDRQTLLKIGRDKLLQTRWNGEALTKKRGALQDIISCIQFVLQVGMTPNCEFSLWDIGVDSMNIAVIQQRLTTMGHTVSVRELLEATSLNSLAETLEGNTFSTPHTSGPAWEESAHKWKILDVRDYRHKEQLKKNCLDFFYDRCPHHTWLDGNCKDYLVPAVNALVETAYRERPCHSFVLLDQNNRLLGADLILNYSSLQAIPPFKLYGVLVELIERSMRPVRKELRKQGDKFLEDYCVFVNPNVPVAQQFQVLVAIDEEFQRRAKKMGCRAVITCNVNPVTQALAIEAGYQLKKKVFIKNAKFNRQKYYTSPEVPDHFYFGSYVKYLYR